VLSDPESESWVDINDVLSCGNKASDQFFTGQISHGDELTGAFGMQLCSVDTGHEQLPEVTISELESLLLMESEGETDVSSGQLAGYVTVNADELEQVCDNSVTQFDLDMEDGEPVTASCDIDEDTSSEEDDIPDTTWSYSRSRHQCRRGRRRPRSARCRPPLRNHHAVDERKKLQNKTAATRYREKKRSEELENEAMCSELEKRNKELRMRVEDMTQEVAVLRKLVVDIFRSPDVCST